MSIIRLSPYFFHNPLLTWKKQSSRIVESRRNPHDICSKMSPSTQPLSELCGQADDTLFSAIVCNQYHVLHGLLPPITSTGHDLRTKSHDRALLPDDPLSRQNFINRMLTNNYYYAKLWQALLISMTSYIGTLIH